MEHKKKWDKLFYEMAEQQAREMGKEFDANWNDCNRPELRKQLETMIQIETKNRMLKRKRLFWIAAACCISLSLLGAAVIHRLPFQLIDNGTHSNIIPMDVSRELKSCGFLYCIDIPQHYTFSSSVGTGDSAKAVFVSGDDILVFTQSNSELGLHIDTEDAKTTTVMLHNGYEGVYIEKNGISLFWTQGNFYFMLYASNEKENLIQAASSIRKL